MNGKATITIRKLTADDYNEKMANKLPLELQKRALRQLREKECVAVTDRPLWYSRLPEWQKEELNEWYEKWLRVTDTLLIPQKPFWLEV